MDPETLEERDGMLIFEVRPEEIVNEAYLDERSLSIEPGAPPSRARPGFVLCPPGNTRWPAALKTVCFF